MNSALNDFVAAQQQPRFFYQVKKEEASLRANPLARTTEILKKVVGTKFY